MRALLMAKDVTVADLVELFETRESFVLASHMRPDGDAIGSMLGLGLTLEARGKRVRYLNEDGVPENLSFVDPERRVKRPLLAQPVEGEVFVALDTANLERLGEGVQRCVPVGALRVTIDHHVTNERHGDLVWVDATAPATAQMVWELSKAGGWEIPEPARLALYVGASTDTGSFQYANTTGRTHEMAADLLEAGLDVAEINRLTYHNFPFRRVELLKALLQTLERGAEGQMAWWSLTCEMKAAVGYRPGDSEGLVDVMRGIDEVRACVFFEEINDGSIRVSMRSKSESVNVSEVCARLGGGGHVLAAGARLDGPLSEARELVLAELAKVI